MLAEMVSLHFVNLSLSDGLHHVLADFAWTAHLAGRALRQPLLSLGFVVQAELAHVFADRLGGAFFGFAAAGAGA